MGVLKIDCKLQDQLFKEIQDSLDNELNYQIEAQNLEVASTFHQALDPKIHSFLLKSTKTSSSRHILTLSLEHGESIANCQYMVTKRHAMNWASFIRAIGREIFFLKLPLRPTSGNFAFREDGSVIVYDYGGVKTLSTEIVMHFKQLIQAARDSDILAMEQPTALQ